MISPETLDTVINAWVKADAVVTVYGPGLAVAAGLWATRAAWRRTADHIHYRRAVAARRRALAAERRQMADLSAAIDKEPSIPTRPGRNQQALNTCNAIWNLPAKEETP